MVSEGVIVVAVGVDDGPDRERGQRSEIVEDLVGLPMRDPGVDDQDPVVADDRPDVLVVERIPPNEDPIADLAPDGHAAQRTARLAYDGRRDRLEHDRSLGA
jgi:hypothetical protein